MGVLDRQATPATEPGNHTHFHGLTVYCRTEEWTRRCKNSLYRFHFEDPIIFEQPVHVRIEHSHANNLSNGYWYQAEPHRSFPPLPPVEAWLPRPDAAP